jgi:aerobic-type carbon monoxide dehydrogenase small subunit (CoxS/CutS family)
MSGITLKVNGSTHTVDVEPSTPLLSAQSGYTAHPIRLH